MEEREVYFVETRQIRRNHKTIQWKAGHTYLYDPEMEPMIKIGHARIVVKEASPAQEPAQEPVYEPVDEPSSGADESENGDGAPSTEPLAGESLADLQAQATELGIKIDGGWGEARLRAEIEAALSAPKEGDA
ncbi:hypothetical protein A1351_23345 [Methylosinus sp. R-45379]|uniref:hypothetical protein n=1 Tax=Methylosinus sp. R-45379 TaxID=980563 RepID=UPI0007C8FB6A|nr:hypothetical protein [Methylosinus sp. R-45379]OAI29450.1 hypothetical protein A1351_23345 [Methylosinus sp. R-45379]